MRASWIERQLVGGDVSLDLVNTVIYPDDVGRREDRLVTLDDVASWVACLGAVHGLSVLLFKDAHRQGTHPETEIERLRDVRQAVDRVCRPLAKGEGVAGDALQCLMSLHSALCDAIPFGRGADGLEVAFQGHDELGLRDLAILCAHCALKLLFSSHLGRLKVCPSCGWLFMDRSKNQRRLWCDMRICGNRSRVKRHYWRTKQAQGEFKCE